MKVKYNIFFLIIVLNINITDAKAETFGSFLCGLNVASVLDPVGFTNTVNNKRAYFNKDMINYIASRVNTLTNQAKIHDAECERFSGNYQLYNQCKGTNYHRNFVVWLKSVLRTVNGTRWDQTIFGNKEIRSMQACELLSGKIKCEKVRRTNAAQSQKFCSNYLGK